MNTKIKNFIPYTFPLDPPKDENALLHRANSLFGYTLGELSIYAKLEIPPNLKRNKGWIGMLLERYLGASAKSKSEQDFASIGIELKTIPVDISRRPLETTFICVAPLTGNSGVTWETSYVRYKLSRVLWIPIEGHRTIPLAMRRIGVPLLWSLNAKEELQLKSDWEELMDLIVLGKVENITAHHGDMLHLRPKASNGKALTAAIGKFGQPILTMPLGFYLRKKFTAKILERYSIYYLL
ncbi:DNA mismatch repair protein MutH [secondary endosymbiont of Trabutina mannipara]|uniref:DNA mismatch repair protein MutH n=1 Tax=secondary endosymbiont of Trabutina mannipara TaxID=1835721 RepID=A0A1C3L477_9ENTR|nr:DNA mismatch repair endonuclease MutH [secondary endosymbiont of Trabutina mannipara]SBT82019.1 DNA mismatch repair protein MutH [secondary endosymbiont of Trabutina mannipara]